MTAIHRDVARLSEGAEPRLVAKMDSGWAVMGREQLLVGYCLLLPDPVVADLNSLTGRERYEFLADMANLGDAVMAATDCVRVNYAIFGNLEPALHVHVVPRFLTEPPEFRTKPYFAYDLANAPIFEEQVHGGIRDRIRDLLQTM